MAAAPLPDPPAQLKAIQSYMKIASDIERVDPIVAYWVRLYATETALSIDRDSPECKTFLGACILWLEKFKQTHKDNEALTNQTVGQAHMENFVVSLFTKADTLDREGTANKNTVKMFYMSAVLFEAMAVFGALTEEVSKRAKYAKFKAAYIQKCLKTGQTPKPGPVEGSDLEDPAGSNQAPADPSSGAAAEAPEAPPKLPDSNPNTKDAPEPFILTPSYPPTRPPVQPETSDNSSPGGNLPGAPPALSRPCQTSSSGSSINSTKFQATNGSPLSAEDLIKGQKYCKFANSALQYDDIPTAVANLEKALKLLKTGQDS